MKYVDGPDIEPGDIIQIAAKYQRARLGMYTLFGGAIAGAAVGYLLARKLGLPIG